MNVLITGADDIWGYLTAERVLRAETLTDSGGVEQAVEKVVLALHKEPFLQDILSDKRLVAVRGDIAVKHEIENIILRHEIDSVFHFETVTRDRGSGENDFDGMIRVNLFGSLNILEACRKSGRCPKIVFCSSCSVFQDFIEEPVSAATRRMPSSTYGTTKACVELLIANYTARGFVDGRNSELPMCVSWKPTIKNTDFMHEVFAAPFSGEDVVISLKADTRLFFNGYHTCIENLIETHEIPSDALGEDRCVLQPGVNVSLAEMMEVFEKLAAEKGIPIGPLVECFDEKKQREFDAYNKQTDFSRALTFGLSSEDFESIARRYMEDYLVLS